MSEGTGKESRRAAHIARLRERYPEKGFADDEDIFGQIGEDYDRYEEDLRGYRDREKTLSDMFASDPRSAVFLNDLREGKDPVLGLVSRFGMEVRDVLDDPEMQEELKAANEEYLKRVAKNRELEEEYDRNMDGTLAMLASEQERSGLSDEDVDAICAAWLQIVRDGVMGKLSAETLTLIKNALHYDEDVAAAQEEGEIAGRNAKIVEKMRDRRKGDGLAHLGGRNNGGTGGGGDRRGVKSMFDWAQEAQ